MKNNGLNWAICDEIEQQYSVCIDIESGTYNRESYNAATGWHIIPAGWIAAAKIWLELDQIQDPEERTKARYYWELYTKKRFC